MVAAAVTPADHDLTVLGAGAAGLASARSAVAAGARTLLITDGPPGGDCTFTGCVPSKTLIEAAADGLPFDKAMARVRDAVAHIAATEDEEALRAEGIDVLRGRARFTAPGRILVNGRVLPAPKVVIATGAVPLVPGIAGLDETPFLTTDSVFHLTDAPDSLAILGGGAVGCELAQAFARLGLRVSIVEAADRLLPGTDPEASALLTRVLTTDGIAVHTGAVVESAHGDGRAVTLRAGSTSITAQRLLVAVGRTPSTDGLGLEAAGVRPTAVASSLWTSISRPPHRASTPPETSPGCSVTPTRLTPWAGWPSAPPCIGSVVRSSAPRRYRRWFSPTRRSPPSACQSTRSPTPGPAWPTCR